MSVALIPSYRFFYQGSPVANGTVNVYQSGTTTPVDIYTDADLTTPAANPITLDANGAALFYVSDSPNLRFDVYTSGGTLVESLDPVYPSTTSTTSTSTYSGGGGFLNKFRNGTFDIWQRGTTGTITAGSPAYTADGWIVSSTGANVTWGQGSPGNGYSHSLAITGASSVTDTYVKQRIEGAISEQLLQGSSNVTVQFTIVNGTGGGITPTLTISHPNSLDNWAASTVDVNGVSLQSIANGATGTVAYTFTTNTGMANGMEVKLDFGASLNSGAKNLSVYGADIRITPGVSTGLNSSPPAVELRPFHTELLFCQRYYWKSFNYATAPAQNAGASTGAMFFMAGKAGTLTENSPSFTFPAPMRAIPSITLYNPTATNAQVYDYGATASLTSTTTLQIGEGRFNVSATGNASTAIGNALAIHATASAEL